MEGDSCRAAFSPRRTLSGSYVFVGPNVCDEGIVDESLGCTVTVLDHDTVSEMVSSSEPDALHRSVTLLDATLLFEMVAVMVVSLEGVGVATRVSEREAAWLGE